MLAQWLALAAAAYPSSSSWWRLWRTVDLKHQASGLGISIGSAQPRLRALCWHTALDPRSGSCGCLCLGGLPPLRSCLPQDVTLSPMRVQACTAPAVIGPAESCQQLLRVGGMTCSSCSSAVETALRGVPGVQEASVNLLAGTAEVRRWLERLIPIVLVHHQGACWEAQMVMCSRGSRRCRHCLLRGVVEGMFAKHGAEQSSFGGLAVAAAAAKPVT